VHSGIKISLGLRSKTVISIEAEVHITLLRTITSTYSIGNKDIASNFRLLHMQISRYRIANKYENSLVCICYVSYSNSLASKDIRKKKTFLKISSKDFAVYTSTCTVCFKIKSYE
jgi:hypothetical protein